VTEHQLQDPHAREQQIADYLVRTPAFFERHAELLARVQITSPHGKRAVSLQERQLEILRERIRGLELKIMEMIRHGQENVAIVDRMHRWTRALMLARMPADVPGVMVEQLKAEFMIPMAAVRLWDVEPHLLVHPQGKPHDTTFFARDVGREFKELVANLGAPYCGANAGFEAASWLDDDGGASVASLALLPLHHARGVVGVLALGSPDPTRYSADMGTELLARIGETASAAVARLIRPA
jgi:uncharacterized protein YigA (DUF484 family)